MKIYLPNTLRHFVITAMDTTSSDDSSQGPLNNIGNDIESFLKDFNTRLFMVQKIREKTNASTGQCPSDHENGFRYKLPDNERHRLEYGDYCINDDYVEQDDDFDEMVGNLTRNYTLYGVEKRDDRIIYSCCEDMTITFSNVTSNIPYVNCTDIENDGKYFTLLIKKDNCRYCGHGDTKFCILFLESINQWVEIKNWTGCLTYYNSWTIIGFDNKEEAIERLEELCPTSSGKNIKGCC